MRSSSLKRLLTSLALVSFARADYYIDDQNFTSPLYSENPGGAKWGPFQQGRETLSISLANGTMMTIDASQCFNYTYTCECAGTTEDIDLLWYTDAACTVADNCQVQIPFTGSGISIYVLQAGAQGINASLAIDGGAPHYNVLSAPPGPSFYVPNVTLFSVQGISSGNHTATMTVQNWDNIFSGMMFDYAAINETIVTATTTASVASSTGTTASSTSPTTSATPQPSHSSTNLGAIAGGIVGGLIALAALGLAILYFRQRRPRQPLSVDLDGEPKIEPFSAESLYHPRPERYTDIPEPPTSGSLVAVSTNDSPFYSTNSGSSRREKVQMGITNPSASQIANTNVTSSSSCADSSSAYSPGASEASRPRIQQTHPMLTDDQADFINSLYANNVPAGAIARVIERMMAGERRPTVDGYESLPPPSYSRVAGDE